MDQYQNISIYDTHYKFKFYKNNEILFTKNIDKIPHEVMYTQKLK